MTANELADLIEDEDTLWLNVDAANMIRQQQAEIEELKTIRGNSVLVRSDKLQAMQAEIEALKMDRDRLDWIWKNRTHFSIQGIELFTIPTQHMTNIYGIRPMIDEAIKKVSEK